MAICEICSVYVADVDGHIAWHEQLDADYERLLAQLQVHALVAGGVARHPSTAGLRRHRWRDGP